MRIKRLSGLVMFSVVVLFSYVAANAQSTTTSTTPTSNPRVVVTDNLAKPSTPTTATMPTTKTTKIGNYNVNVTENVNTTVQNQSPENGRFLTMTKWDGTKWVTKREWVPNGPAANKPNPQ